MTTPLNRRNLPRHIAIIMDGNGRWAQARGLPRVMGHKAGIQSVREVIKACGELQIRALTLYAFSTENWKRPKREVETLMRLLDRYLEESAEELKAKRIRFRAMGRLHELPPSIQSKLERLTRETHHYRGLILNVALNYSGQAEIVDAVRTIAERVRMGVCEVGEINEASFATYLYTHGLPNPDLLIRTSGEMRLSNFLLWQVSYCELYVTSTLWPDFRRRHLEAAIREFQQRERRFGDTVAAPPSASRVAKSRATLRVAGDRS